ncbi:excinuclease ABC subunit A [Mobilicoccus caccae]|uniref:UvrABC system protein A n=1 Tax=Mobilicoccus caccae TaxID=1859295 RepID=A0ABQ6ILE7_9MICO|nr:excinuclease ABC subunit UvrA [Mobilicoccus caccae]GMA38012.1 excinuclease ABC subunit A [Mobilicoccus caccae]
MPDDGHAPHRPPVAAGTHDVIRVRGARVHNLRDVDVDIPKRLMTVFVGRSGSGKSSLAFGTVAAESRRLIDETYSTFIQGFMPTLARPEVDELTGLTAAIIVDQERMGANSRSTVGTVTDAYSLLRLVFSRLSTPHVGASGCFSFNLPDGMCPTCEGTGRVAAVDEDVLVDRSRSLNEGAILAPNFGVGTWYWRSYGESDRLDPDKALADYSEEEWRWFMHAEPVKVRLAGMNATYEGLLPKVRRVFLDKEKESRQKHVREFVERVATFAACPECGGARLNEAARTATVAGVTIPQASAMQIGDLLTWLDRIDDAQVAPLVRSLREMLAALDEVGLGYLSLDREAGTLSGGEAQRVKMVRHLGSALTDCTYVFDEPTAGLHPHDVDRMVTLLQSLRDKGNTVLVVEHKPAVMDAADHVVELGPGAGADGGTLTYAGGPTGLRAAGTTTGRAIGVRHPVRADVRTPTGALEIRDARTHNLKGVSVDVPTGVLVVVTGVAGSGKSSLIYGSLAGREGVLVVDQSPIRGSRRSNPATYTGLLDPIRNAFAKANGVAASLFSANSTGACPTCQGMGVVYTDLAMMAGVETTCPDCRGRRFTDEVLGYRYQGHTIDEVLRLTATQAREVFRTGKPAAILDRFLEVGLPYLTLGQPLTTLSGGERQRIKLVARLRDDAHTYVLDEPTTGMHLAGTANLIDMLHRLVERGRSVVAIEHNLAVMTAADWIIDVGPGAGHQGGEVVFTGTPRAMIEDADTLTAEHLRRWAEPERD